MNALSRLWREHRVLLAGFVAAGAVTLFFLVRMIIFTAYWSNPAHRELPLAGWMTLHYAAYSWHVPPDVVIRAANLAPPHGKPPRHLLTLREIAAVQGISLKQLTERLQKAIDAARAQQDPPAK